MTSAQYLSSANTFAGSRRSRVTAVVLSLAVVAVILFLMIEMGLVSLGTSGAGARLVSFNMSPSSNAEQKQAAAHPAASRKVAQPVPHPQQAQQQPRPPRPLWLSHDDFAAADIARLPRHDENADTGSEDSKPTYGPGEGPGGVQLFNARWYREPTDAQLRTYLPERVPPGAWATIACRMVEHYHVEDCRELDEAPPGLGLARSIRQASWQFLVLPPMKNGQQQLGTWVRIRIDFTRRAEDPSP